MNHSDEKFGLILVGFEAIETTWWRIKLRVFAENADHFSRRQIKIKSQSLQ